MLLFFKTTTEDSHRCTVCAELACSPDGSGVTFGYFGFLPKPKKMCHRLTGISELCPAIGFHPTQRYPLSNTPSSLGKTPGSAVPLCRISVIENGCLDEWILGDKNVLYKNISFFYTDFLVIYFKAIVFGLQGLMWIPRIKTVLLSFMKLLHPGTLMSSLYCWSMVLMLIYPNTQATSRSTEWPITDMRSKRHF